VLRPQSTNHSISVDARKKEKITKQTKHQENLLLIAGLHSRGDGEVEGYGDVQLSTAHSAACHRNNLCTSNWPHWHHSHCRPEAPIDRQDHREPGRYRRMFVDMAASLEQAEAKYTL
jgi:hypothetical protein